MSLPVTKEQEALADSISRWATNSKFLEQARSIVNVPLEDRTYELPAWWQGAVDLGLTGLVLPEELGGSGAGLEELNVALTELGRHLVMGPLVPGAVGTLVLLAALVNDPSLELARGLLNQVALGTTVVVVAKMSTLKVTQGPSGLRITGELPSVLGAEYAQWLIARGEDVKGETSWYLLPIADNIVITPHLSLDVTRPLCRVLIDDVEIPSEYALKEIDTQLVDDLYMTVAAGESVGLARWAQETATAYAKVREQFGRTIGSFQAIKHLCSYMYSQVQLTSAASYDAAAAASAYFNSPSEATRKQLSIAAAAAGVVGLPDVLTTTHDCIQVHGGIGMTWEHNIHLFLRRAMTLKQLTGETRQWRARVASFSRTEIKREWALSLTDIDPVWREELRTTIRSLPTDEVGRRIALAESGLIAPHWDRPYGLAATPLEQLAIKAELASAEVEVPDLVVGDWSIPTIIALGTDEQREKFAMPTLRGEMIWCQLFSEPGAGSDLSGLRTKAIKVEGGWSLTGQKVWTSMAMEADWGICLARSNLNVSNSKGITYFLVDMKTPGVDVRPLREITGEAWFNEVFIDDVFVPDNMVVGEVDSGWQVARATMAVERTAISNNSTIGDQLVAIVKSTHSDPVLDEHFGELLARIQVTTALGQQITIKQLEGLDPSPLASIRKLAMSKLSSTVSEMGVTTLGKDALDISEPLAAARTEAYLFGRSGGIGGGTTQVMLNIIGERILGLPRD